VSISDAGAAEVRRTRTYRAAVWCARLAYVWALAWSLTLWVVRPSGLVVFLTWLAGLPLAIGVLVSLRRSGVRFVRRRTAWYIEDREIGRQFYRDILWLRR
jgi:hypothetical protein